MRGIDVLDVVIVLVVAGMNDMLVLVVALMLGAAGKVLSAGEGKMPGESETDGTITDGSAALSPGVLTSVAPSPMPAALDPEAKPVTSLGSAVARLPAPPQLVLGIALEGIPPPSNVEVPAAMPVLVDVGGGQGKVLKSGLMPTVFSSVAPIGIPVGPTTGAFEFTVLRGDVAPMPDVPTPIAGATCAKPASQPIKKMIDARVRTCRIKASISFVQNQ